jgi:hypothetical protein
LQQRKTRQKRSLDELSHLHILQQAFNLRVNDALDLLGICRVFQGAVVLTQMEAVLVEGEVRLVTSDVVDVDRVRVMLATKTANSTWDVRRLATKCWIKIVIEGRFYPVAVVWSCHRCAWCHADGKYLEYI